MAVTYEIGNGPGTDSVVVRMRAKERWSNCTTVPRRSMARAAERRDMNMEEEREGEGEGEGGGRLPSMSSQCNRWKSVARVVLVESNSKRGAGSTLRIFIARATLESNIEEGKDL
jgi:hypothetical protein